MHGVGGRTRIVINSWKEYRLCVKLLLRVWGLAAVIRGDMDGGGCLGEMILSPEMLAVFLLVAVAGSVILYLVANRKWGYTKKRERELEEQPSLMQMGKKGKK